MMDHQRVAQTPPADLVRFVDADVGVAAGGGWLFVEWRWRSGLKKGSLSSGWYVRETAKVGYVPAFY